MSANEEAVKVIVASINGTARESGKAQEAIKQAIGSNDTETLIAVCEAIEAKYLKKEERNARLSILRTQMSRACGARGLDLGYRLTVKKLSKVWRVVKNVAPDEADQAAKKLERELADIIAVLPENESVRDALVNALESVGYSVQDNNARPQVKAKPTATRKPRAQPMQELQAAA